MTWLVTYGFINAVLATLLASAALVVGRWCRRPALAHLLWVLVLCKLLTPALVKVPLGDWFDPPQWLSEATVSSGNVGPGGHRLDRPWTGDSASSDSQEPEEEFPQANPPSKNAEAVVVHSELDGDVAVATTVGGAGTSSNGNNGVSNTRSEKPRRSFAISPGLCLRWVSIVWVAGSLLTMLWLVRRLARFGAYLNFAARPDERLQEHVAQLARTAGMSYAPRVVVVDCVVSPMLWGVGRRARLVFPSALGQRLDADACNALLLHELAHYARGDGWIRLLELAVQVVYWWHPLVWWARHEIEAAEEECCDAWVLERQTGTRRSYAEALLAAIDFLCEPPPLPPVACGLGDVPLLRRRLTLIMRGQVAVHPSRAARVLVLGAAAAVLPLGPGLFGASSRSDSARILVPSTIDPVALSPQRIFEIESADEETSGPAGTTVPTGPASIDGPADLITPELPALPHLAPPSLWASATSPNGKYRLEARAGRKTTLVHVAADWRLDLSSHKIVCASYSPDSQMLATGHDDSIVRIWDCETGGISALLRGSESAITSVAFAPDGRRIAAGTANGDVHVWDSATHDEIARIQLQQPAGVSCIRWSNRGDRLAVALGNWSDGEAMPLVIWAPDEGSVPAKELFLDLPVGAVQWLADYTALLVAAWDGEARVWNLSTNEPVDWLSLKKVAISAAAWSPDCPLISRWQADRLVLGSEP